jgi:hypothetical protein
MGITAISITASSSSKVDVTKPRRDRVNPTGRHIFDSVLSHCHTLTPTSDLGGKNSMETKGLLPASLLEIKSMILGLGSMPLMVDVCLLQQR